MPNRPAIKIIQNRHFLTTTPEKSVCAVAAHMRDNNEGVVLVVAAEDGKLLGALPCLRPCAFALKNDF